MWKLLLPSTDTKLPLLSWYKPRTLLFTVLIQNNVHYFLIIKGTVFHLIKNTSCLDTLYACFQLHCKTLNSAVHNLEQQLQLLKVHIHSN